MIAALASWVYIDHAGLHTGFSHDGLHLPGDIVKAVLGGGADLYNLLHGYKNNQSRETNFHC